MRGKFYLCRNCQELLTDQESHLWQIKEDGKLINKKGTWKYSDKKWYINEEGFIEDQDSSEVLGIDGTGVTLEEKMEPINDLQIWTKSEPDKRGWFRFQNPSNQLLLIANTSKKLTIEIIC